MQVVEEIKHHLTYLFLQANYFTKSCYSWNYFLNSTKQTHSLVKLCLKNPILMNKPDKLPQMCVMHCVYCYVAPN